MSRQMLTGNHHPMSATGTNCTESRCDRRSVPANRRRSTRNDLLYILKGNQRHERAAVSRSKGTTSGTQAVHTRRRANPPGCASHQPDTAALCPTTPRQPRSSSPRERREDKRKKRLALAGRCYQQSRAGQHAHTRGDICLPSLLKGPVMHASECAPDAAAVS
jgi:hypothetical protein